MMATQSQERQLTISVGNSRKETNWRQIQVTVDELFKRLENPVVGAETLNQYVRMTKSAQDELKDVGGFVAGALDGPRRKASAVIGRDAIALDFDNIPANGAQNVVDALDAMDCTFCVYSTRKHAPNKPRLRILVPTDRTMSPDEYEPCSRRIAEKIGIGWADPSTFEVGRLMYWPSRCADGEYFYRACSDRPLVSVNGLLATYRDWRDVLEWPQVPGSFNIQALKTRQGDPLTKPGVVGTFCRCYDVFRAMDELLPGTYEPVDTGDSNRFTYMGGSTTGGAVVYNDGRFLFSHHATDPCSGKLVNAFDLVRLHKFGDRDADPEAPMSTKTASYVAMCEYAVQLPDVVLALDTERREQAQADFAGIAATEIDDPKAWQLKLKRNTQTGQPLHTIDNAVLIAENDPALAGKIALNEFAGRREVLKPLPWDEADGSYTRCPREWCDADESSLRWFFEREYGFSGRGLLDDALNIVCGRRRFNPVRDFVNSLSWDGVQRLDSLFVDYLGAADTLYTRAVTRKMLVAAIARAMEPGCKFDNMLILAGPQGIGKSTILRKLSREFFNDSISTFEGRESAELIQGVWIVEVAELDAFRRSDVARVKQFLSLGFDRYRAAYGHNAVDHQRTCVFFGTCNRSDFLQDTTGNRRFWPVDVGLSAPRLSVFEDLNANIDQIWAEARARWIAGEPLHLSADESRLAEEQQSLHFDRDPHETDIVEFCARPVPDDWIKWPLDRRRDFWAGTFTGLNAAKLVPRTQVCAKEVWAEFFLRSPGELNRQNARAINDVLRSMPGWKECKGSRRYAPYANTRGGFTRG